MKKVLSVLLAVLVIGICAPCDANAKKKRTSSKPKATTTATVEKGAFKGFWCERAAYHGLQLIIEYDSDVDTYSATLYGQDELCSGKGSAKGNTLYLDCNEGFTITCTLKGGKLYVKAVSAYAEYNVKMCRC